MIKKMKYETPEVEITCFEVDRRIMDPDGPGDPVTAPGASGGDEGDQGDLLRMLEEQE